MSLFLVKIFRQDRPVIMGDMIRLYTAGKKDARAIVFTETKKDANELVLSLKASTFF
jgi:superfamily II DNA/RNA helicase